MSWVGQIALGAYLVFILGTVAVVFATILLASAELPFPGQDGFSSEVLPGRKTVSARRQRVDLNQAGITHEHARLA